MMYFTIDRFEGSYAIAELSNGQIIDVPNTIIPVNAKEGDIVEIKLLKNVSSNLRKEMKEIFNNVCK